MEKDWSNEIIQGTPFCKCGTLMVCLDGVNFICPNPECNNKEKK